MADISMGYYALESLAADIVRLKEQLNSMYGELDKLVSATDGRWQGCAQCEFAAAYEKLQPKLSGMSKVLESYHTELLHTIEQQKETEHISALQF